MNGSLSTKGQVMTTAIFHLNSSTSLLAHFECFDVDI